MAEMNIKDVPVEGTNGVVHAKRKVQKGETKESHTIGSAVEVVVKDMGAKITPPNSESEPAREARPKGPTRSQQLSKLYALPVPIRTFPLPTFIPHNPLSLLSILYTWVSQVISPPNSFPETRYQGWFSPETRSVHITDPKAIRAFWEQGFFGKGTLSRSEPSWLEREKRRQGESASSTSEENTRARREERQRMKWERARIEREAIDQRLLAEKDLANNSDDRQLELPQSFSLKCGAPVGPLELLALPNSILEWEVQEAERVAAKLSISHNLNLNGHADAELTNGRPKHPKDLKPQDSSHTDENPASNGKVTTNGSAMSQSNRPLNGSITMPKEPKSLKSVRFSPTVEQTTFLQTEPPSPDLAALNAAKLKEPEAATEPEPAPIPVIIDKEHLQLTMEEAFFLNYGLGVLNVLDPETKEPIPTRKLLALAREFSYFPTSKALNGSPDDPFMISYVVYHHFRSLGWVVRGGAKFAADFLLYNRGPVFSHAEFVITILPSYSDPYWAKDDAMVEYVAKKERRSWSWLHCVNRVNTQAKKTLILVYVDIPSPLDTWVEEKMGIDGVLGRYKVREIVLKRWSSNRSR